MDGRTWLVGGTDYEILSPETIFWMKKQKAQFEVLANCSKVVSIWEELATLFLYFFIMKPILC